MAPPRPQNSSEGFPLAPIPIRSATKPSIDDVHELLTDRSRDLLCRHDLNGTILSVNSVPAHVLGYTVEELLRMRLQDLLAPEYRPLFDQYIRTIEQQQVANGLMTLLTRTGERRIWEYHNVLQNDSGTQVVFGIAHDVTETRRTERTLRRLADLNRAITANALEGIIVMDRELRYMVWNRFMEKMTGVKSDEVFGKHVLDAFPILKEIGVYDQARAALDGDSVEAAEVPIMSMATRETRWFSTNITPLRDSRDQINGVIATLHDITERRRAEEAAREKETLLRGTLESTADGILVVDEQGEVTHTNGRFAEMWRIPPELMATANRDVLLQQVSSELLEPEIFLEETRALNMGEEQGVDFIKFKDGRIFERFSCPLFRDGKYRRRVWSFRDITERERSAQAVRESEEKYRKIVELAGEGIWTYDDEAKITWVNRQMAEMLGYTPKEAIGLPALSFVSPDDVDVARAQVERRKQGVSGQYELKFRHKDGRDIWTLVNATPVRDAAGNVVGGLGMVSDITERKRAEEQLFNSRQMLQSVLDNIPQRVFCKDRNFKYVACNKPLAMDAGHEDPHDLLGKTDYELPTKPFADLYRADDREVMETGRPKIKYEEPQIKADGSRAWLMTTKVPMYDRNGQVIAVLGTYEDITERKRAEEALRRSESQLRSFVENAPYGITRASVRGNRFLNVNPATIKMLGCDSETEALSLRLSDLYVDPGGREAFLSQLSQARAFTSVELRWKRKDGKPLTIRCNARMIHDEVHDEDVVEEIFENITERRLLEERFFQAQKMEAVGRLAGGVAHDFNNLLEVILGYAEILAESEKIPAKQQKLEEIISATRRAASLTGQLLAFSRKQVLEFKVLSLNTIVSDTDRMLRRLIGEDIHLQLHLQPDLCLTKADPAQIGQVIMNLAVNARDAMPQGGELIIETTNMTVDESTASRDSTPPPGSYVVLAVSDNGAGMDPSTQEQIFDPFFTTKPAGQGTGLGLATVYGIVKQCNGCIRVSSELGRGTRFEIFFPKVEGTADSLKHKRRTSEIPGGDETILLAEDSASLRIFLCEGLTRLGYKVLPAADGAEAVHLAEREERPIHLLITDVVMPDISGPDLISRMRSLRPEIKVLVMSGYTDDRLGPHPDFAPQSFLQKPFSTADLAQKIRSTLRHRNR